jgi:hypothetical protein
MIDANSPVASATYFCLRQQGTLRFIVADFSPAGRKIGNNENNSYRSLVTGLKEPLCLPLWGASDGTWSICRAR